MASKSGRRRRAFLFATPAQSHQQLALVALRPRRIASNKLRLMNLHEPHRDYTSKTAENGSLHGRWRPDCQAVVRVRLRRQHVTHYAPNIRLRKGD